MPEQKSIRLAFVASTLDLGGAERVVRDVVTGLPAPRFRSRVYLLRSAGAVGRELIRDGVEVFESIGGGPRELLALVRLTQHLRRWRPDVVFCLDHHNAMFAGRVAGIASRASARVIASHSTGLFGRRGSFRLSDRLLMDFTECVVALSRSHERYLRERERITGGRIVVIENGVDVARFAPSDDASRRLAVRSELGIAADAPVVTMVAALRPEKAHEALLEAARRLREAGRGIQALVVGGGPRRKALERLSREMGLDESVRFLGPRDDIERLLRSTDVVVLPSHDVVETLPLAVLEAMASGVPVVASRVGSLPEVIRSGENGILIPAADGVALADAIQYRLDDRERAAEMARRARQTVVERYSRDRMVDGYAKLFERLTERN